jgi:class 3 adenylate cyclase
MSDGNKAKTGSAPLVAILAADVEGYSRHMERDEAATLATLSAHRVIVDELIASHNGRITGTAGDSVLAEFASVVDAVRCAVAVQRATAARETNLPADRRIEFRVGVNVGDVVVESDGDLLGDGVNLAARLEAIAEPGGIWLSERRLQASAREGRTRIRRPRGTASEEHRPSSKGLQRLARQLRLANDCAAAVARKTVDRCLAISEPQR